MKQNTSSKTDGSTSELYQMEKWSSKNRLRENSKDGLKGMHFHIGIEAFSQKRAESELGRLQYPFVIFCVAVQPIQNE